MKKYKVAILGATGAVGREMMKVLAERDYLRGLLCGRQRAVFPHGVSQHLRAGHGYVRPVGAGGRAALDGAGELESGSSYCNRLCRFLTVPVQDRQGQIDFR